MPYRIVITPVSSGTTESESSPVPGNGSYVMLPDGPTPFLVNASNAQIVAIQGYITAIIAGTNTSTVETAILAIAT